jgi:hypothetical protein
MKMIRCVSSFVIVTFLVMFVSHSLINRFSILRNFDGDDVDGDDINNRKSRILKIPIGRDGLMSNLGEGAIKMPNDNGDKRNLNDLHWMAEMFKSAAAAGLTSAPKICRDVHFGTIERHKMRGNHRHHDKAEIFVAWNAKGVVRVERPGGEYTDYEFEEDDRVLISSPAKLGHAIKNTGNGESMIIVACSDAEHTNEQTNDYNIWADF